MKAPVLTFDQKRPMAKADARSAVRSQAALRKLLAEYSAAEFHEYAISHPTYMELIRKAWQLEAEDAAAVSLIMDRLIAGYEAPADEA